MLGSKWKGEEVTRWKRQGSRMGLHKVASWCGSDVPLIASSPVSVEEGREIEGGGEGPGRRVLAGLGSGENLVNKFR